MCEITGARMSKTLWRKTCIQVLRLFIRGKCLNLNWPELTRKWCNWPKIECEYTTNMCKHNNDTWDRYGQLDHFWMIFWNSPQASKNGSKMGNFRENRLFPKFSGFALGAPWMCPNRSLWTPGTPYGCLECLCLFNRSDSLQKFHMKKSKNPPMESRWVGSKLQNGRE